MKRRGLSLLELMIAFGVVAVAILAILLVFTRGLEWFVSSTDTTLASATGRQVLDEIRQRGPERLPAANLTFDGRAGNPKDVALDFPPDPYPVANDGTRNYTMVVRFSDVNPRLRSVLVEVYWNERSHVKLETYVARP